jgi:hypothetical protein
MDIAHRFRLRISHSGSGRASLPLIVYTGTAELEIFIVAADGSVAAGTREVQDEGLQKSSSCGWGTGVMQGGSTPASLTIRVLVSRQRPLLVIEHSSTDAHLVCLCDRCSPRASIHSRGLRDRGHHATGHFPPGTGDTRLGIVRAPSPLFPQLGAATMLHSRRTPTHHATAEVAVNACAYPAAPRP